jgi:hypothetical protein
MTAFAAPEFGTPEAFDRMLAAKPFLQARDLPFFNDLVARIRGMARPSDNIHARIPDPWGAGAWRVLFGLYQELKDREAREQEAARSAPSRSGFQANFQADQAEWNRYIGNRETILAMLARDAIDTFILVEHLDLQPNDLGEPTSTEHKQSGGRHPEWRERAARLHSALFWWGAMSPAERRVLFNTRTMQKLKYLKEQKYG